MIDVTPSVDVIVPVYGNWQITRTCLRSLRDQTITHRVILVDDKSPDDTLERVNISLPRRVLHRLDARARSAGETRSGFIARMAVEGRVPVAHA